jgi:hypothetical protein
LALFLLHHAQIFKRELLSAASLYGILEENSNHEAPSYRTKTQSSRPWFGTGRTARHQRSGPVGAATPHRGSYRSGNLARRLSRRLVSLPREVVSRGRGILHLARPELGDFFRGNMPTSLDGMSPENPGLLALADFPVDATIKAHSIIPTQGEGDPRNGGRDGVVTYESAHVDYVESECIVRSSHTCLGQPATIEEVRRILHEHFRSLCWPAQSGAAQRQPSGSK